MRRIQKLLIANRGEIAVRIQRTCREAGIATVAVYSDADADAPHVRLADEAVRLGPAPANESYLRLDRLLAACWVTGADALHPGFGFLSERAELAEACADAGITFVGPTAAAMRAMGLKREAKETAQSVGVPVIPGDGGADQTIAGLLTRAQDVGFPLLVKASAGGGGKGMRIVRDADQLEHALTSAKREAASSFGDDTVLLERYVERPRHVEVQLLGDQHGQLVHLFERECSIQRRHQKIIEESPSVALDATLRAAMGDAAVRLGQAIGYTNAGTVEFILAPDGAFYFLEVNTRLQVEHPVTEAVVRCRGVALDLVREQLRLAEGEPLGYAQADLTQAGAAVECRLYAEDPRAGFLPQTGHVTDWHVPEVGSWLRVDTGIAAGQEIGIHYDPMLAKVITSGRDRAEATRRMTWALEHLGVAGVTTNRDLLLATLRHPDYVAGALHTHFVEEHLALVQGPSEDVEREAAIGAALWAQQERRAQLPLPGARSGFRNNAWRDQRVTFGLTGERALELGYADLGGGRFRVTTPSGGAEVRLVSCEGPVLVLVQDGVRRTLRVTSTGADVRTWFVQTRGTTVTLRETPRLPDAAAHVPKGGCVAPMPGKVTAVLVSPGQAVEKGQRLVVLEAMKMEHALTAPHAGVVSEVLVTVGQQVVGEHVLVVVGEAE